MNPIKLIRIIARLLAFAFLIIVHVSRGFWIHWFVGDANERKRKFSNTAHSITKVICRIFGIRVHVINEPPKDAPGLVIGNHLGFIDIMAAGATRPLLFVTSIEMRNTPVLGLLTEMGGCIYVERRNRMGIQDELKQMIDSLKSGFNICLYPEATSHNGEHVLPFKRTLLSAAAHAGVPVLPYVFNFRSIEGKPFSLENRDKVCWYGDMPFITALLGAFSLKYVDVEIKFLEPLVTTPEDDRASIAHTLHQLISKEFIPVQMPEGHTATTAEVTPEIKSAQ